ncbi:MAG: SDR family NAD(P)-dependent oxidoreductase [Porticoccaceae bacterium]|nr:SDR family NAD(P)-dependent oxidoreductase [Porticoccaceae bacterium]MBT5103273.1 SDR family NAD(P)-dependent oxidoreductase [Porticoccaceae bacterium]MBT6422396.1 SDR family NAD(P)-dependent oxidoreductase [Porticoccaceae bacterium]MBT7751650.1 SDR family NAD(P)-dependent oxidoreductase [Porticoccaceae bacterium]
MKNKVALIIGAGDAIGSAIARKFSQRGLTVCLTRRNEEKLQPLIDEITATGADAFGFACDARKEDATETLFSSIEENIGEIDVVVFNIGANVPMGILETDSRKFFKIWEMACFAGFLNGREAARYMTKRKRGTILFTGATASVRGSAGFAAFASAKHGLRALAQSMARELGPKNIHVAHIVIDAAVDTQWIKDNLPTYEQRKAVDGIVKPDDLATNYVTLYDQPRNAWTFELDIRPWDEKW